MQLISNAKRIDNNAYIRNYNVQGVRCAVVGTDSGSEFRLSSEDVGKTIGVSYLEKYVMPKSGFTYPYIVFDDMQELAKHTMSPNDMYRFVKKLGTVVANSVVNDSAPNATTATTKPTYITTKYKLLPEFTNEQTPETYKKQIHYLLDILGDGAEYKVVNNIPWFKDIFLTHDRVVYRAVGIHLTGMSKKMGVPIKKVYAFGSIPVAHNSYHVSVIEAFYNDLKNNESLMFSWRKPR